MICDAHHVMLAQHVAGSIKVNAGWTRALYTSHLVSMVTAIWQSLGVCCVCVCACARRNTQLLSLNSPHGVWRHQHVAHL